MRIHNNCYYNIVRTTPVPEKNSNEIPQSPVDVTYNRIGIISYDIKQTNGSTKETQERYSLK